MTALVVGVGETEQNGETWLSATCEQGKAGFGHSNPPRCGQQLTEETRLAVAYSRAKAARAA